VLLPRAKQILRTLIEFKKMSKSAKKIRPIIGMPRPSDVVGFC
jgi:hypothetical protein